MKVIYNDLVDVHGKLDFPADSVDMHTLFTNADIVRNPLISSLLGRLKDDDFYDSLCDNRENG